MLSLKELLKLQKRSVRNKEGLFLIEGKKIIEEAVQSGREIIQVIATDTFEQRDHLFLVQIKHRGYVGDDKVMIISESNAERLTSSKTPAGIFAVVKMSKTSFEDLLNKKFIVVFEDVKDPGNLGTMIRTADWFGADAVITTTTGVDPYNDKVLRSTMGSIFHLPIYVSANLKEDIEKLKLKPFKIITTRPETQSTKKLADQTTSQLALIIGNESLGTSPDVDQLADSTISIPGYGKAESLNASVSFGIVMYMLKVK